MKLFKKLLPIAAVASTAAIVAPIITSCGIKSYTYEFDEENPAIDFEPENQISEESRTRVSAAKATEFYLREAKKDKKILADDIVYAEIRALLPIETMFEIESGSSKIKIGNIDPITGKISYLKIEAGFIGHEKKAILAVDQIYTADVEIKNMDFVAFRGDETEEGYARFVGPLAYYYEIYAEEIEEYEPELAAMIRQSLYNYLKYDDSWSFKALVIRTEQGIQHKQELEFNSEILYADASLLQSFCRSLNVATINSYHLANVDIFF